MQNKQNYNRSKPEILRLLLDDRLRICLILSVYTHYFYTKFHIYVFSYKLETVLNQFLETETSDRCLTVSFNS